MRRLCRLFSATDICVRTTRASRPNACGRNRCRTDLDVVLISGILIEFCINWNIGFVQIVFGEVHLMVVNSHVMWSIWDRWWRCDWNWNRSTFRIPFHTPGRQHIFGASNVLLIIIINIYNSYQVVHRTDNEWSDKRIKWKQKIQQIQTEVYTYAVRTASVCENTQYTYYVCALLPWITITISSLVNNPQDMINI